MACVSPVIGKNASSDHWCDLLHVDGAEAIATYTGEFFAGRPAVTRNQKGKGVAYYLGTRPDRAGLDALLRKMIKDAKIQPALKTPAGVEATLRESPQHQFLFLLNHNDRATKVSSANGCGRNLVNGQNMQDTGHPRPARCRGNPTHSLKSDLKVRAHCP